ncbi:sulfotransferase domain-containing protein [Hyphobacterium sp. CCMP332]|nr:sulfotransferase domain-containing protein [Hyphobacterium sp. CCMP332]
MKPGLVLIPGIRKCGTTTLYDMLAENPQLFTLKDLKESQIFCLKRADFKRNIDKLTSEMDSSGTFLDASTLALYSSNAIANIKSHFEKVKIVFIIRKPQTRFVSAYMHNVKKGNKIENRTLKEVIEAFKKDENNSAIELSELEKAKSSGKINYRKIEFPNLNSKYKSRIEEGIDEDFTQLKYYRESCYSAYIEKWENEFGKENCLVISLEELRFDTEKALKKVTNFLRLENPLEIQLKSSNMTYMANSFLARTMRQLFRIIGLNRLVKKSTLLKSGVLKIRAKIYDKEKINNSESYRRELDYLFSEEMAYWENRSPEIYKYWMS